jgi:hypothetical protein
VHLHYFVKQKHDQNTIIKQQKQQKHNKKKTKGKQMSNEDLKKLKKSLPKGYRSKLAEQFNCSKAFVDMVIAGTRKNTEMIFSAYEIARSHKDQIENIAQGIQRL